METENEKVTRVLGKQTLDEIKRDEKGKKQRREMKRERGAKKKKKK